MDVKKQEKAGSGRKHADKETVAALKAAVNRGDSQFSVNGKTYRIAKDAGIIEVRRGKR